MAPDVGSDGIWLDRHPSCRPHLRIGSGEVWGCLLGITLLRFQVVVVVTCRVKGRGTDIATLQEETEITEDLDFRNLGFLCPSTSSGP